MTSKLVPIHVTPNHEVIEASGVGNLLDRIRPEWKAKQLVLWGQLNDRHKISSNLLRDDDVRTVEDEDRQFVMMSVPGDRRAYHT